MLSAAASRPKPVVVISDLAEAVDDTIALLMLLRAKSVDVRGVITTAGNACAHEGAAVAKRLLAGAGAASIPVFEGLPLSWHEQRQRHYEKEERPSWQRQPYVGAFAGTKPCESTAGESAGASPAGAEAIDFLLGQARAGEGAMSVVLTGPATLLAEALRREPELARLVKVYAMGGALSVPGNVTAHAEFNVWFDPEAMQSVLASNVPVTLLPLDATEGVTYEPLARALEAASDFATSELSARLNRPSSRGRAVGMWDEVLAAIVIDPALVQASERLYLSVATAKNDRYGGLVSTSVPPTAGARPVEVVMKVDRDGVRKLLARLLVPGG